MPSPLGVVIIGRNEGERLRTCLASVQASEATVVYVDSGSTDSSVALAKSMGATVVELDLSRPFTAARARNAGFARLIQSSPATKYVQFIDGDCALASGWLDAAADFLETHPDYAVTCGRRRERAPEASIYNQLCDLEWNTPTGDALACGGDALMRISALQQVAGFDEAVIAGEEPELCVRLRQVNWKVFRLNAEMTLHDAAMTRFAQWWRRNVRGGYAFALGTHLHGEAPEHHWTRETRRILCWGMLLPLLTMSLAWPTHGFSMLLLLLYPLQMLRLSRRGRATLTPRLALASAFFNVLGKFPEVIGVLRCGADQLRTRPPTIIEYKAPAARVARV